MSAVDSRAGARRISATVIKPEEIAVLGGGDGEVAPLVERARAVQPEDRPGGSGAGHLLPIERVEIGSRGRALGEEHRGCGEQDEVWVGHRCSWSNGFQYPAPPPAPGAFTVTDPFKAPVEVSASAKVQDNGPVMSGCKLSPPGAITGVSRSGQSCEAI